MQRFGCKLEMEQSIERDTEHSMGALKNKILAIYRNAPRTALNTTAEERAQLRELCQDSSVVVKQSDKCKGLVIMNKEDYLARREEITSGYDK